MEKFAGISRASNSYWSATWTAYLANVTDPSVASSGLTPPIPAIKKYVCDKSNLVDAMSAMIVTAALISAGLSVPLYSTKHVHLPPSPVVSWQMLPSSVQWTSGKSIDSPGTVMLAARTLNSGMPYHASASGANYAARQGLR